MRPPASRRPPLGALTRAVRARLPSTFPPQVHSPEEFEDKLAANKDKMVVLMCKATHCRPCKVRRAGQICSGGP